jgi:hypothetical protein
MTHFTQYGYDDFRAMSLRLPVLPVFTPFPADCRTESEVRKQIAENSGLPGHPVR